jgi:hypothetical protein
VKGIQKLPAVHDNLNIAFAECTVTHLVDGQVWGTGFVMGALTNDALEVMYTHAGETEAHRTVLLISGLHYDAVTRTGFYFTPKTADHIIPK